MTIFCLHVRCLSQECTCDFQFCCMFRFWSSTLTALFVTGSRPFIWNRSNVGGWHCGFADRAAGPEDAALFAHSDDTSDLFRGFKAWISVACLVVPCCWSKDKQDLGVFFGFIYFITIYDVYSTSMTVWGRIDEFQQFHEVPAECWRTVSSWKICFCR